MKWPWVSREAYDLAVIQLDAARLAGQQFADWYAASQARNHALNERLLSLKTAGAVEVPKPLTFTPATVEAEPDELRALIGEVCGSNYRLRSIMLRSLARDRADGVSEDDIRAAIVNGVQVEGVPI